MYRPWLFSSLILLFVGVTASGQEAATTKVSGQHTTDSADWTPQNRSIIEFNLDGSYLGVFLEEVTSDRMKELGLSQERGAVVMKVVKDSPADKAGMKENDVIVSFNGRPVDSVREFERLLGDTPSGRTVAIEIWRNGARQTLSATVSKRNDLGLSRDYLAGAERAWRWPEFAGSSNEWPQLRNFSDDGAFAIARPRLGISAEPLTTQLAAFFGVKEGGGVLVSEVTDDSPAGKAGLKVGDVIVAVDGSKIESVSDLRNQLSKKQDGSVVFKVVRNHRETSVTVNLEKTNTRRVFQRVSVPRLRVVRPLQSI